jgi:hypothetical protein
MALFEELAREKSARIQSEAREMIDLSRSAPASSDGSASGFSPEHDPTHQ